MIPSTLATIPAERRRLNRQCLAILARLQSGTATNRQLSEIGLRFGARIMELRQAGYAIEIVAHDHASGLVTYALVGQMEMRF